MSQSSSQRPPEVSVDTLIGQAQQAISKARYSAALDLLRRAAHQAPEDADVRRLWAQTEEAARRHEAAVARHLAVVQKARQLEQLLERGDDRAEIRSRLQQALLDHGRHDALVAFEARLTRLEDVALERQAVELMAEARTRAESGDWRGALQMVEKSLRLSPSEEGEGLRARAHAELDHEAEGRHYHEAVEEARRDVDRLIGARELPRAGQRLRQAKEQLGGHQVFDELGQRIDKAKSDFHFRQRVEWAERRANEAERLIEEADRCARREAFDEAARRLEAARELDPSHPDLGEKLVKARQGNQRQLAAQQRSEAMALREAEIRNHLDALRLDAAADALRQATDTFGEPQRFAPLNNRLTRLREVENAVPAPTLTGDHG